MAQISGDPRQKQYEAGDQQTVFIYPFKIYGNGEITVQYDDTTLILTEDYTVQGAGEEAGGTITLVTGATVGVTITLTANTKITRDTTWTRGGPYGADEQNAEFAKSRNLTSELSVFGSENFRLAIPAANVSKIIPFPVIGKGLKWNATGTGLVNTTNDPDKVNDQTAAAAAAALVSEDNAAISEDAAKVSEDAAKVSEDAAAASAASIDLGDLASNIIPDGDGTRDIGSGTKKFNVVHTDKINGQPTLEPDKITMNLVPLNNDEIDLGSGAKKFKGLHVDTINDIPAHTPRAVFSFSPTPVSTPGGSYTTANVWQTRPIDTKAYDTIGCTLSNSQITVPIGNYIITYNFVSWGIGNVAGRLFNVTATAEIYFWRHGGGAEALNTNNAGMGYFNVTVSTKIELQMIGFSSQATFGMGHPHPFGTTPYPNVNENYLNLILTKVG